MINKIIGNTNISYNTTFSALPLAKYRYPETKGKDVILYQLEKTDIDYLRFLINHIEDFYRKFNITSKATQQVAQEAFSAGIEILKGEKHTEEKAKVLMSFYDNEPCSILIGNALKIDKGKGLHYSSRKNHAKGETELDWLATWNAKIPCEGKITVYEYFLSLIKDGFKEVFVRSELPEKSPAKAFYERMGFKTISDKPRLIQRKNDNSYLIGQYDDFNDYIIPMKATVKDISRAINTLKKRINRNEIEPKTCVEFAKQL